MSTGSIMVFARAPLPGAAKTRLIPALGADGAARLHAFLVERTLTRVCEAAPGNTTLWGTPSIQHPFFQYCRNRYSIDLHEQQGNDLGARMQHAFSSALQRRSWAILLGTDCPDLDSSHLAQAISAMQDGSEAVVGPAFDGGYYLLGLRQPAPTLFENMPWGSSEVLGLTLQRLHSLGRQPVYMPWRQDLDRPSDLQCFDDLPEWARQGNAHFTATDSTALDSTDSTAPA
ncbi:TIGR04282 family arsenosugar biosynthesis glycosyltransferase [Thiolapillus sp.]